VVAPAGPFDRDSFEAGLAVLDRRYQVSHNPGIFDQFRYLAGSDDSRLAQLTDALAGDAVRAVFCARGGYGAMRLLPRLPTLQKGPPLIGFSDITALHQWYQCQGLVSIHGPVVTQLGRLAEPAQERLFHLLESANPAPPLRGTATLVPGMTEGVLLGGNLSVFTRLLGTPYLPPLDGAILLLEDLAERPYRLDRMWTHMQLAGVFRKVRGIALGTFTSCEERDASYSSTDVLKDLANATGLPCAMGFPIGHGDANEAVPLGTRVRLDADACSLTFLEPAVSKHQA
jgi:muramoyltetrapeptide carboxypeptidase